MSQPPILTRAAEDEADISLQMPSSPSAAVHSASASSSPASLDSLWSQYEAYLESAQAAQEAGIDIFPEPAFVIKVGLLPRGKKTATATAAAAAADSSQPQLEGDKLFINVCTDAAVDAPEIIKAKPDTELPRPEASSSSPSAASAPPGSLRLPLSVGPLCQCLSRSGVPSLCVDVVVHPDAVNLDLQQHQAQHEQVYSIALAQAAIIQRRDGVAPAVPSPAAAAAMTLQQVKHTVASLAIDKLQAKYGLRVDEQAELRFPKLRYKGTQPPPAQTIRRNRDNPLHQRSRDREREREEAHKPLIVEVKEKDTAPTASRSTSNVASDARQSQRTTEQSAEISMKAQEKAVQAAQPAAAETGTSEDVRHPEYELSLRDGDGKELPLSIAQAADYRPSTGSCLHLAVHLPGIASIDDIESTVTASDVVLTARSSSSSSHAGRRFSLQLSFPVPVNDADVSAKFSRKKEALNIRLPLQQQQQQQQQQQRQQQREETKPHDMDDASRVLQTMPETVTQRQEESASSGNSSACGPTDDWAARLSLSNSLLRQLCI